jgi:2-oxoglutarate ferredoxin oxidoreductase subunit delta
LIYSKNGEVMIETKDDWCKGCGICIERCPVNALEDSDRLNKKGIRPPQLKEKNECNFCRLCELICPDLAITVIPDKEVKKDVKKPLLSPTGGKNK